MVAGNFMDVLNIIVGGAFGGDWTLFVLIALAGIAIMSFKWRLPAVVALGMSWGLVYAFYVMTPSSIIQAILALISLGIVVSIISSLLKYGARSQN